VTDGISKEAAGVQAFGWLPPKADAQSLAEYASKQGTETVLLSAEDKDFVDGLQSMTNPPKLVEVVPVGWRPMRPRRDPNRTSIERRPDPRHRTDLPWRPKTAQPAPPLHRRPVCSPTVADDRTADGQSPLAMSSGEMCGRVLQMNLRRVD
jgi:hypothetical protein